MTENSQKTNIFVKLAYEYRDAQSRPTLSNFKFFSMANMKIILLIHSEPEEIHRHFLRLLHVRTHMHIYSAMLEKWPLVSLWSHNVDNCVNLLLKFMLIIGLYRPYLSRPQPQRGLMEEVETSTWLKDPRFPFIMSSDRGGNSWSVRDPEPWAQFGCWSGLQAASPTCPCWPVGSQRQRGVRTFPERCSTVCMPLGARPWRQAPSVRSKANTVFKNRCVSKGEIYTK